MIRLLGMEPSDTLGLSIFLHIGTGAAALTCFRKDFRNILQYDSEPKKRMFRFLMTATLATGFIGLPLFLFVKVVSFDGEALFTLTGIALVLTGLLQKKSRLAGVRKSDTLTTKDGLLLGLIQGLSVIPGLSRSGLTTSALLIKNF